jgi:hypothetical protein
MARRLFLFQVALVLLLLPGVAGAAEWIPAKAHRNSVDVTRQILGPYSTLSEVNVFVGSAPDRCEAVSDVTQVCLWPLSKATAGWMPLAQVLETGDRLNLICEFPLDGSKRAESSCSVHPQRSNRPYFRGQFRPQDRRMSRTKRAEIRESESEKARQLLSASVTAFELSTLVGDIPDQCFKGGSEFFCTWGSHAGTYGHGTLAMSIEASFSKKVKLRCTLPADGGPRAADSCQASVGG